MYEQVVETTVATAVTIDPVTLLTVILTALAVLLTALAIMIGIAAVWGYVGIKDDARKIATEAAHKKLIEYFENESLKDKIRTMVRPPAPGLAGIQDRPAEVGNTQYQGEEGNNVGNDNR
jgi:hypothetical protein